MLDPLNLGQVVTRKAIAAGADQSEAYVRRLKVVHVRVGVGEKSSIVTERHEDGVGIRVIRKGFVGFACTDLLKKTNITRTINNALKCAKISTVMLHSFPTPKPSTAVHRIFDPHIASMKSHVALDIGLEAIDSTHVERKVCDANMSMSMVTRRIAIVNSLGLTLGQKLTFAKVTVRVSARRAAQAASSCVRQHYSTTLKDFNLDSVTSKTVDGAIDLTEARILRGTSHCPVVLSPYAAASVLRTVIGLAACSDDLLLHRNSYLRDKINRQVASSILTVYDEGRLPAGILSSRFDGEGVPTQRTLIVEDGVLLGSLFDTHTATECNVGSTGNASRGLYWDHRVVPYVAPTNIIVTPKHGRIEDLTREVKSGLLVSDILDEPDITSNHFSSLVTQGYKIEDGEVSYPVKQAVIGMDKLDFLKQIDAIGNDSEQVFGVVTPSIRARNALVMGV